jgi:hypothetical protein
MCIKLSFTINVQFCSFNTYCRRVYFTCGYAVWVVCTRTRTRLPDGYMMLHICVPAGRNMIPYPPLYRVKPVRYSGFGYPLPSLVCVVSCESKKTTAHQRPKPAKPYLYLLPHRAPHARRHPGSRGAAADPNRPACARPVRHSCSRGSRDV